MARKPSKPSKPRKSSKQEADAGVKNPGEVEPLREEIDAGGAERDLHDRISRRAYRIWEEEGWPHGREAEHWSRAEREIAPGAGPGPEPIPEDDRSRAVAPPKPGRRPGASTKLGGTPSAPAAGKGRGE